MVSLSDVKAGKVSLADIAEANHYLDMKSDMEYYLSEKTRKEVEHGWRSNKGAYHKRKI